jgi:Ser/Thr protein kinase RdoA (MazF antagonist)
VTKAWAELDFVLSREAMVDVLLDLQERGEIPERITHNDTKFNNVLLDESTNEAVCVVDLDTVMPGLALYDFGDMVRSATNSALEDERDLSKVAMRMPIYEGLVSGYLASAGSFLTPAERAHLAFSGKLITLEIGLRFLTDYLEGDVYFKTRSPDHNLDRCRNQFALVRSIEQHESAMQCAAERIIKVACES